MNFHPHVTLNFIAIIVAAIIYYIIGFLWYSVFFKKTWMEETNVKPGNQSVALALGGQFLSTLLYTLGLGILFSIFNAKDVMSCVHISLFLCLFFVIPVNSGNLFFNNKKKLFLIDVSERIVGSLVIAIILAIWQ
ncbi:MAG TPA: DUF1761 domain-containing protein [Lentimicrobium sp.]|jgi:uncharacterized membrane protein YjfL (UPF0719 family)|nr:DUF1761 domain-containing protein [Lentimicrobium sp.]